MPCSNLPLLSDVRTKVKRAWGKSNLRTERQTERERGRLLCFLFSLLLPLANKRNMQTWQEYPDPSSYQSLTPTQVFEIQKELSVLGLDQLATNVATNDGEFGRPAFLCG